MKIKSRIIIFNVQIILVIIKVLRWLSYNKTVIAILHKITRYEPYVSKVMRRVGLGKLVKT